MTPRVWFAMLSLIGIASTTPLHAQGSSPSLRHALQATATNRYPLLDVKVFGQDSALLVFQDSAYTGIAANAGTWMFGPPVTAAEADSCPPQKVLGRRIARVFWRQAGKRLGLSSVVVRVRGDARDPDSYTDLYYYHRELEAPWAGDSGSR
ncbi:MAG TPA: hypothetical protein VFT29_05745 [Gemmatimonadaceae bacterium]|nr:hypothetical protein [Gemmatimonadaceae bacterium]